MVLGARPQKAMLVYKAEEILGENPTKKEIDSLVDYVMEEVKFESNMRGSKEYRQILAKVFINRGIEEIMGGTNAN